MYLWMIGGIFGIAWILHKLAKRIGLQASGIRERCTSCGYDLDGHESVLGVDIWVGPEICPECGRNYPAIG